MGEQVVRVSSMLGGTVGVRIHRTPTSVLDRDGEHWRSAMVKAVSGALVTLTVQIEAAIRADRTCAISLLQAGGVGAEAGNPCVVRVDKDDAYAVEEVRSAAPLDVAADVAYWGGDTRTFNGGRVEFTE